MDTMISFSDNNLAGSFMTKEDIRNVCPKALYHTPTNPAVSQRYAFADTETVIDDLAKFGWLPVAAKQCREKANSKGIRSFHMLAFQNPNVTITKTTADGSQEIDCYPRIILTNSHDGFNSFKFMVGLYRCVCSNGLVIATDQMVELNIKHINYDFGQLQAVVSNAILQVNEQVKVMNVMQRTMLTVEQKTTLAISALTIRKGGAWKNGFVDNVAVQDVLVPTRSEDEGDSLWNVFNVLQEYMMKGTFKSKTNENSKKARKARAITSVTKGIDFNRELFKEAYKYVVVEETATEETEAVVVE